MAVSPAKIALLMNHADNQPILYLHGFASSSLSIKAQQTKHYFQQHWPKQPFQALDLPYAPQQALQLIEETLEGRTPLAMIGSSLGGFLATCIAERYGCRACLINPAVAPHRVLSQHLGRYYHPVLKQYYDVTEQQISILQQLMPPTLAQPENYLVLLQSGDEVLDYRLAVNYYDGANISVIDGGDHSFVGYEQYLSQIARFCQLAETFCYSANDREL